MFGPHVRTIRSSLVSLSALWISVLSVAGARAVETGNVGGEPVRIDVTNASSVFYNVDNRNTRASDVSRRVDDGWGVWYNRLNTQASWKRFQAGVRLDSAWFYTAPTPTRVALDLLKLNHGGALPPTYSASDANFFELMTEKATGELTTRYVSWVYPSKYYLGYTTRDVEATVGDFYTQLGRGLVLSVRKVDELASDTTVRGGRVTGHLQQGPFRLRMTALGGSMNPLRLDEASGRYIGVTSAVSSGFFSITEAGMPRAIRGPFDTSLQPTYAPDRVLGAQLEGGVRWLTVGVQASALDRQLLDRGGELTALSPGTVRGAKSIRTGSISLSAPDFDGHGAGYLEVAVQDLVHASTAPDTSSNLPSGGHAAYGSVSVIQRPLTITLEGKHYRRFFSLLANVDTARATEYTALQYSAPPTTEPFWTDTEFGGFNTCVTGGRVRTDVEMRRGVNVYAALGRYLTWAESIVNERCDTSPQNLNRVWDAAGGFEIVSQRGKSRASATVGSRFDDAERLLESTYGETHTFYREVYTRYDVIQWLGGPFALKFQGWHRRRHQTLGGPQEPYIELQHLTSIEWAPRLSAGIGLEYTGNPLFAPTYVNGVISYAFSPSSNISIFAGQRRGGLRCVSGVCRVFPPFEGVRIDATFRF
jgi:hypothetical protein